MNKSDTISGTKVQIDPQIIEIMRGLEKNQDLEPNQKIMIQELFKRLLNAEGALKDALEELIFAKMQIFTLERKHEFSLEFCDTLLQSTHEMTSNTEFLSQAAEEQIKNSRKKILGLLQETGYEQEAISIVQDELKSVLQLIQRQVDTLYNKLETEEKFSNDLLKQISILMKEIHALGEGNITGLTETQAIIIEVVQNAKSRDEIILSVRKETQKLINFVEQGLDKLKEIANKDALTGVYNRGAFEALLDQTIMSYLDQNGKFPLTLIIADIDHFKKFNDDYGHIVGDAVLKKVAAKLAKTFADPFIVSRYGGEEFSIILPKTDLILAKELAEKFKKVLLETNFKIISSGEKISVTCSLGIAELILPWKDQLDDAMMVPENRVPMLYQMGQKLIKAADTALYCAKNNGRNRVEIYESPSS